MGRNDGERTGRLFYEEAKRVQSVLADQGLHIEIEVGSFGRYGRNALGIRVPGKHLVLVEYVRPITRDIVVLTTEAQPRDHLVHEHHGDYGSSGRGWYTNALRHMFRIAYGEGYYEYELCSRPNAVTDAYIVCPEARKWLAGLPAEYSDQDTWNACPDPAWLVYAWTNGPLPAVFEDVAARVLGSVVIIVKYITDYMLPQHANAGFDCTPAEFDIESGGDLDTQCRRFEVWVDETLDDTFWPAQALGRHDYEQAVRAAYHPAIERVFPSRSTAIKAAALKFIRKYVPRPQLSPENFGDETVGDNYPEFLTRESTRQFVRNHYAEFVELVDSH